MGWEEQGRYSTKFDFPTSTTGILSKRLQDVRRNVIRGALRFVIFFPQRVYYGSEALMLLCYLGGRPRSQWSQEFRRTADGRCSRLQDFLPHFIT